MRTIIITCHSYAYSLFQHRSHVSCEMLIQAGHLLHSLGQRGQREERNNSWWTTTFHRYGLVHSFVCSFAWHPANRTTYEFNVNFGKFIVLKRTHEVRWNECSCIASAFQIHYTPNDIDFNFINKTQRLSHSINKYLDGRFAIWGAIAHRTPHNWSYIRKTAFSNKKFSQSNHLYIYLYGPPHANANISESR